MPTCMLDYAVTHSLLVTSADSVYLALALLSRMSLGMIQHDQYFGPTVSCANMNLVHTMVTAATFRSKIAGHAVCI